MKIYFIENSIEFTADNLNDPIISGTEKTLINLSNELAKNNRLTIKVFNQTKKRQNINNVEWINIGEAINYPDPDILVAHSDMSLLDHFKCNKKYLWSHSIQNLEKFIRKKQLLPYLRHRPKIILEGDYHYKNRSFLTSFFGKQIVKIAPDYDFINEKININEIPFKTCIFITKSDRNLNILLNEWVKIYSKNQDAKLKVNPPFSMCNKFSNLNIILRDKGSKSDLIKELKKSRLMLIPGHKGEVFCLAAEEARELCVPIVTYGYGSLYERVIHNKTGFIAKNSNEFVHFTNLLLNDDELYLQFRKNLLSIKNSRNYSDVALDFIKIISN